MTQIGKTQIHSRHEPRPGEIWEWAYDDEHALVLMLAMQSSLPDVMMLGYTLTHSVKVYVAQRWVYYFGWKYDEHWEKIA